MGNKTEKETILVKMERRELENGSMEKRQNG